MDLKDLKDRKIDLVSGNVSHEIDTKDLEDLSMNQYSGTIQLIDGSGGGGETEKNRNQNQHTFETRI